MAEPLHKGETSLLTIEVHQRNADRIEVKLQPKLKKGEIFPEIIDEHGNELTTIMVALKDAFGDDNCIATKQLDHRLVTVTRPADMPPVEFGQAVVDTMKGIETVTKSTKADDPEHIGRLVDGALERKNRYDQVKHIISDKALSPAQRTEALEVLRMRRNQIENGIE